MADVIYTNKIYAFHPSLASDPWGIRRPTAFVTTVKVTSDVAERRVKLITEYAQILTKDEMTRKFLLQGMELHRRKFGLPKEDRSNCVLNYSVLDYTHLCSACLSAFCFLGRI